MVNLIELLLDKAGLILTVSKELTIGYIPFNKYQTYDQKL